ncbi:uncharacterized [Tachysurus ichikawai]
MKIENTGAVHFLFVVQGFQANIMVKATYAECVPCVSGERRKDGRKERDICSTLRAIGCSANNDLTASCPPAGLQYASLETYVIIAL